MFVSPIDPQTIDTLAREWGALALTVSWKGLVLLVMALALHTALRRGAASARHLVWTGALIGLFLLPILGTALPGWEVPGLRVPTLSIDAPAEHATLSTTELWNAANGPFPERVFFRDPSSTTTLLRSAHLTPVEPSAALDLASDPSTTLLGNVIASARAWSTWTWALLAWEFGVIVVVAWLSIGWWHLRSLQRRSTALTDPRWLSLAQQVARELGMRRAPRLVRTTDAMTPLTWGVLRPVVLLPAPADQWSEAQRIDVLRHEFAHVARRDVLTQFLAQLACALLWFHPLPWIAAARMRLERERACDDQVLLAGSRASSYAGHLLDMARSLRSEHSLAAATIGMARRSQLGERMDSLLDDAPRARHLGHAARLGLCVVILALLVPLAAMRPQSTAAAQGVPPRPPVVVQPVHPARPVAPYAVAVAPSVGSFFGITHGISISGDLDAASTSYEVQTRHSNFSLRKDDMSLEVELDGHLRFAEDETDVEWMEAGSYFELEHKEGRERRRMEIEADQDGVLERTYFVGGRRTDIDDEARTWFAAALGQFMAHSGIATEPRVRRWMEEDGVDGAIGRIGDIDGDYAAARHWSALLGLSELSSDDRAKVLTALPRDLDSDFERGRGLAVILGDRVDRRNAPLVMGLVDDFDSDFEKARVLVQALPLALDDEEARQTMWRSIEAMDSDFEKARVIAALAEKIEGDETMLLEALTAAESIDSDFEKARLLRSFAEAAANFPATREKYVAVAEGLDSDHEYGQVMRALKRAER